MPGSGAWDRYQSGWLQPYLDRAAGRAPGGGAAGDRGASDEHSSPGGIPPALLRLAGSAGRDLRAWGAWLRPGPDGDGGHNNGRGRPMSRLLVDADAIRALADILNEPGLTEIETPEKDGRIRVVRAPAVVQALAQPAPLAASASAAGSVVVASAAEAMAADHARHPGAIKSPMVGIAYLSPEPSAPPFVSEGQQVSAGQTIMLIEA